MADPTSNRRLLGPGEAVRSGAFPWPGRRDTDGRPFAGAFASTRAAVHVFTEDGVICHTNPAFDRMFRSAPGEVLGKHQAILNVHSVAANELLLGQMRVAVADRGFWQGRVLSRRRDGTDFVTELHVFPVCDGGRRYFLGLQHEAPGGPRWATPIPLPAATAPGLYPAR